MPTAPARAQAVFVAATEITDPGARTSFLAEACGGDPALKARVEALLRAHDQPDSLLDAPFVAPPDPADDATLIVTPEPDDDATRTSGGTHGPAGDDEVLHFLTPSARPDSLGRIGHYELLQVLGKGGFGIVFRAFDNILQRVVAVKVMAPQLAATSPARKRFLREARTSAGVRHENVVQVHEVAESPLPYIAMEFIPGETLQQRLNRTGPLDAAEVVRIGRQIAEGLAAAHATDLIHRDIKPGNVLIEGGPQQRVKITDFGLARAADDASISQSGLIAGTPMYMAPEQALGQDLDQRADLFSLGSVLYQMAAGRPPFRANNTVAVLKRVAEDTPRDIRAIIPETPQWLCDIIAKLHAKNPDDRYQSARAVADVLADCEAQLKTHSRLKDFSRIPRGTTRPAGRRKWVAAAAVLLLPMIALAVTEFAGVTHLLRGEQATTDPIKPGDGPSMDQAAKPEPLPPAYKNTLGMEFVIVPKGKSWLGGGKDKLGDKEVEIPADFYLGKYEVTQEEWTQVMAGNPSRFSRRGLNMEGVKDVRDADLKRFPVENVSWDECQLFVAKLNKLEKETGWVYRLPKEMEWEYACRGGPTADRLDSAFDFYVATPTNILLPEQANFDRGLMRTCKVGSYAANRLGLYDMHGNVFEWCDDNGNASEGSRMFRGGGWQSFPARCVAITSIAGPPAHRTQYLGLRLARVPSGAPSPEAKAPPVAAAPFTDADVQRIAALPAAEQVEEVRKELVKRNPGFDGTLTPTIENDVVTGLKFHTGEVDDIAPLRALKGLTSLDCGCSSTNRGELSDLSPLKGLPLTWLELSYNQVKDLKPLTGMRLTYLVVYICPDVTDLSPLKGMPIKRLSLGGTRVQDLSPLKGMRLNWLNLWSTPVKDLEPLKGMPIKYMNIDRTGVSDLKPLEGGDLEDIILTPMNFAQGLEMLRNLKSLKTIGTSVQAYPAPEFWERYDKGEFKGPLAVAPFTDADVQRITALPAAEQVEEVRKELMRLNPAFDGKLTPTIANEVVTELSFNTDRVDNVAPVRALAGLIYLDCRGTYPNKGKLSDLSPLKGMKLSRLDCSSTQIADLAPLVGVPLTNLHFNHNPVSDITPLKGMPLLELGLAETKVSDLSPLRGMKLKSLGAQLLPVTDLSPLEGMPLTGIDLYHTVGVTSLAPLKGMPLEGLNLQDVPVSDLSPLAGMTTLRTLVLQGSRVTDLSPLAGLKLTDLLIHDKQITDLSPLKGLPLTRLTIDGTGVSDLNPLQGMPLIEVRLTPKNITRGLDILRGVKSLKTIGVDSGNAWPAAEFWERYDKGEFKK